MCLLVYEYVSVGCVCWGMRMWVCLLAYEYVCVGVCVGVEYVGVFVVV